MTHLTPCVASLRRIVKEHTAHTFVWDDETVMPDDLPDAEVERRIEAGEVQPLLIDPTTAHLLISVCEAARPATQERIAEWIAKDRAHFAHIVERAWQCASPRSQP